MYSCAYTYTSMHSIEVGCSHCALNSVVHARATDGLARASSICIKSFLGCWGRGTVRCRGQRLLWHGSHRLRD